MRGRGGEEAGWRKGKPIGGARRAVGEGRGGGGASRCGERKEGREKMGRHGVGGPEGERPVG
jgi:hypothetical protein